MLLTKLLFLKKKYTVPFVIFLSVFIGYLANAPFDYTRNYETKTYRRLLTSYDITANTFLPYEIIKNHQIIFSNSTVKAIKRVEGVAKPHSLVNINGNYISGYPILAGLISVPIYALPILVNKIPNFVEDRQLLKILLLGRISASFYTAISVVLFYFILKKLSELKEIPITVWTYLFVVFFAFGTNVYSIASRGLWQHTTSLLLICTTILVLLYANEKPFLVKWLGLICGLAFLARPTNIILIVLVALYVFINYKNRFIAFMLFALPTVIFLLAYNYVSFGSPFVNEYGARKDTSFSTPLLTGLTGYLVSPSRSFLFVTPPLVLTYFAIFSAVFKKNKDTLDKILQMLGITFLLTLCLFSMWWCWYGADRFGYGFLTEWMPIAVLFTFSLSLKFSKLAKVILVLFMLYSFYTQFNAVLFRKSRCSEDHIWDFYCLLPPTERQNY